MNIDNYYEQQGSGAPMVFIHGSYATTATWKKMVERLAASHHCISVKLPGHGGAPEPHDVMEPSIKTELSMLEKIIDKLTEQPVHLIGHSYGGVVALSLALKGSVALRQMTLFEPVAVWVLKTMKDTSHYHEVQQFLQPYRDSVAQQMPYACGQVINFWGGDKAFEALPDTIKQSMQPLAKNNIRHWDICISINHSLSDLQQCAVPTQLVYGNQSNPVAHAIVNHLHQALPNSNKNIVSGASHFLVTSHVNECLSIIGHEK